MIGIIIAAHAGLPEALIETARLVLGGDLNVVGVSIGADESTDDHDAHLKEAIAQVDKGEGVLVLTDLFGGTPSNVGMTVHRPGAVEVITGVNLPMLIKAMQGSARSLPLDDIAQQVKAAGQRSIVIATEALGVPKESA